MGSILFEYSTGGLSGLKLPGDEENYYWIQAGLDECVLKKMTRLPDGTVQDGAMSRPPR